MFKIPFSLSFFFFFQFQITGALSTAKTVSVIVRGSNKLVLDEADRSIHDALCVIRCLVKNRCVILAQVFHQD